MSDRDRRYSKRQLLGNLPAQFGHTLKQDRLWTTRSRWQFGD
jgi:hypothetical protein